MRTTRFLLVLLLTGWMGTANSVPITDTVLVDGTVWAQVDLFAGLSWNNIHDVCPGSVCKDESLNNYDMGGWIWASVDDLAAAFNPFLIADGFSGDDLLGPGPDRLYYGFTSGSVNFGRDFIRTGFRPTYQQFDTTTLIGWTSNLVESDPDSAYRGVVGTYVPNGELFGTNYTQLKNRGGLFSQGAWFFRGDAGEVPVPATLPMILLGLSLLVVVRRLCA